MKTATLIKDIPPGRNAGHWKHYRLSDTDLSPSGYVIVSAMAMYSGPETYIFPADEAGKVTDWGELDGSYRGGLDHDAALTGAGYTVVP